MKTTWCFVGLSVVLLISTPGWSQIRAYPDFIIYDIPTSSEGCLIDQFFLVDQPQSIKMDAQVLVLFDEKELIIRIDIPASKSSKELKKCFLSDEFDLRLVPNITISLDPEHRHGIYYKFIIDQEGHRQDLRVDDESWTAAWTAVTKTDNGKLWAEVRIPVRNIASLVTAGTFWGFDVSLNGIFSSGDLHTTPMGLRTADAANFGHLLFTGNLEQKKISEIRSSLPDIHISNEKKMLEANRIHCGPEMEEIPGEIYGLDVGEEIKLEDGTGITCLGVDNSPVIRSGKPFYYEKYENPELQRLRNQYSLEEIIAPGKNDFEQILLLNEWLANHVPFGSPPPIRPQALQVLYYGLNGQTFYCTYLSFTLMQMYCSLGFTARKITSVGHGTLDVWSDYWGKWMQIDPSRNSYFRLAGTAVPLNSNEIRREFHRNGGIDMEMVFGTGQRAERVTLERRDRDGAYRYRQEGYEWIAYKSRNNFFEIPFTYWNFDYLIPEDEYNRDEIWEHRGKKDVRDILGIRTSRIEDIFWTLNQAYIHLYDQGTTDLKVQIETHTPNFDHFEVSIDNEAWEPFGPVFSWGLHEGQNFIKTRSVNKFGVAGHEHKMVLRVEQ